MKGLLDLVLGCFGVFFLEEGASETHLEESILPVCQASSLWEGQWWEAAPVSLSLCRQELPIHCIWLLLALSDPIMPKQIELVSKALCLK